MSDMQKWINLIEGCDCEYKPGQSVSIGKEHGGGIGQFVAFSPERGTAEVNVKGQPQHFQLVALSNPMDDFEQRLDHDSALGYDEQEQGIHQLHDKPEFQAGESVTIDGIYGSGMGEGYGVFVAYSADGTGAIINYDGTDQTFPTMHIARAPEQPDQDNFFSDQNDGSLSPMSVVADGNGVEITNGESGMDEFEKWMGVVENSHVKKKTKKVQENRSCSCMSHDCTTCFPLTESEEDAIIDLAMMEEDKFDEEIVVNEAFGDDEFDSLDDPYAFSDMDDEESEIQSSNRAPAPASSVTTIDDELSDLDNAEDHDVGEKIGKILYMQDMGMSRGKYDPDKLQMMSPKMIDRIYAKVVGESAKTYRFAKLAESSNIDPQVVNSMMSLDVDQAKNQATDLVQDSSTSNKKKAGLVRNIEKLRSTADVVNLLYNMILRGEGLGTINSKWDKQHEAIEEEPETMQGAHAGRQHGPIEGMEGPFRAKNGMVYYYDPMEGKAYDPDTDHYLSDQEYIGMSEMSSGGASGAGGMAMGGKQYDESEEIEEQWGSNVEPNVWVVSGQRGGPKTEVLAMDRKEALSKARWTNIPKPHSVIKIGTESQLMQTRGYGLNGRKPDVEENCSGGATGTGAIAVGAQGDNTMRRREYESADADLDEAMEDMKNWMNTVFEKDITETNAEEYGNADDEDNPDDNYEEDITETNAEEYGNADDEDNPDDNYEEELDEADEFARLMAIVAEASEEDEELDEANMDGSGSFQKGYAFRDEYGNERLKGLGPYEISAIVNGLIKSKVVAFPDGSPESIQIDWDRIDRAVSREMNQLGLGKGSMGEDGMDAYDMGDMVSYDDDEMGGHVPHDHNDIELVSRGGMRDISHDDGDEPGRYASSKGHRIPGRFARHESTVKSVPGVGINESKNQNLQEADADVVRAMKALFE